MNEFSGKVHDGMVEENICCASFDYKSSSLKSHPRCRNSEIHFNDFNFGSLLVGTRKHCAGLVVNLRGIFVIQEIALLCYMIGITI